MQAYVLHSRKYTDSRLIVDFLTTDSGRISAVTRTNKKQSSLLQPFKSLDIEWKGRGELKTVIQCEPDSSQSYSLSGGMLYCGLYLNELLQRLLPVDEENLAVFESYQYAVRQLAKLRNTSEVEPILRIFEFSVLKCLGFAVQFTETSPEGKPVQVAENYFFISGQGLVTAHDEARMPGALQVSGQALLAIDSEDYASVETRKVAKAIARRSLAPLLGNRPLKSRELFQG